MEVLAQPLARPLGDRVEVQEAVEVVHRAAELGALWVEVVHYAAEGSDHLKGASDGARVMGARALWRVHGDGRSDGEREAWALEVDQHVRGVAGARGALTWPHIIEPTSMTLMATICSEMRTG
eukprot:6199819-Prymnesium_polylepis.1